jgi:hypothetical protein
MTDRPDPLDRALEVLVFAPLGAGLYLRDVAPSFVETFVSRGRAEVDRRQEAVTRRLTTARSLGQVAIAFGLPMARERAKQQVATVAERTGSALGAAVRAAAGAVAGSEAPPPARPVSTPGAPVAATPRPTPAAGAPAAGDLPIPGYDALSASQVVERLAGLTAEELGSVRDYEAAHRNRRTILGKIEQLSA